MKVDKGTVNGLFFRVDLVSAIFADGIKWRIQSSDLPGGFQDYSGYFQQSKGVSKLEMLSIYHILEGIFWSGGFPEAPRILLDPPLEYVREIKIPRNLIMMWK